MSTEHPKVNRPFPPGPWQDEGANQRSGGEADVDRRRKEQGGEPMQPPDLPVGEDKPYKITHQ